MHFPTPVDDAEELGRYPFGVVSTGARGVVYHPARSLSEAQGFQRYLEGMPPTRPKVEIVSGAEAAVSIRERDARVAQANANR
jgi:hypothetical protein